MDEAHAYICSPSSQSSRDDGNNDSYKRHKGDQHCKSQSIPDLSTQTASNGVISSGGSATATLTASTDANSDSATDTTHAQIAPTASISSTPDATVTSLTPSLYTSPVVVSLSITSSSTSMVALASNQADLANPTTHAGMIAGAIIGSFVSVFLLLLGVLLFLRRRRRRNQLPPSAEFMSPNDEPFHVQHGKSILSRWMPHQTDSQRLVTESDNPPPFTVGSWKDPVLEKAASAERQQTEVLARLDSRNAGRTYVDFEGQSYAI